MRPFLKFVVLVVISVFSTGVSVLRLDSAPLSNTAARPWWDTYDEALRAVDREDWNSALKSLQEVIAANPKSNAHARTYGMRFIEYYPYYYLGLAYYKRGEMEKALEYLNREKRMGAAHDQPLVVRQIDFYVQAATYLIEARQVAVAPAQPSKPIVVAPAPTPAPSPVPVDVPAQKTVPPPAPVHANPPEVIITSPRAGMEVREATVHVHGDVYDDAGITELAMEVNGQTGPLEIHESGGGMTVTARRVPGSNQVASMGQILNFATDLALAIGENTIVVRARNIHGQEITERRTIRRVKSK